MSVRDAFLLQAEFCETMGSPFTARLCRLIAQRLRPPGAVAERVLSWPGDPSSRADALPLRLAGALHGLVIERRDAALAAVYPPHHHHATDTALWAAVSRAFEVHADEILNRLQSPPQTNEVQRSAALCPGFLTVAAQTGLPLAISELGASAGLNLLWDRFAYRLGSASWGDPAAPVQIAPEWQGAVPPLPPVQVIERAACDQAPIDLRDRAAQMRLLSFVWADQEDRFQRLRAAMALVSGVTVDRAEAGDWLAARLAALRPGAAHVIYHSIAWQYFDAETQARCQAALSAAGARATYAAPLAWLRLEGDGQPPGAALTLTLWPGGITCELARADFHGRWVDWRGWDLK